MSSVDLVSPRMQLMRHALTNWLVQARQQFLQLDRNDPSSWPRLPRLLLCVALGAAVVVLLWMVWLRADHERLQVAQELELRLREEYRGKVAKAANLEALEQQRLQVTQYVMELEKQLPSKAEMDALLSDINHAGIGRGLQFELFKPGPVVQLEHYAEQPIALRVTGDYHAIGAFVADVARLPRIVTLNNLALVPHKQQGLTLEATAKTYRYLEPSEIKTPRTQSKVKRGGR